MRNRRLMMASALTAVALTGVAMTALQRLPKGTQLPTHWGADGLPDGFADAGTALFIPVALTVLISLAMAAIPALEPMQDQMDQSAPLYRTVWGGLLGIMILVQAVVAAPAFGVILPATTMLVGIGALFVAIGNVLPKSRPGFFVGIRTPWAIVDPDNWIATHRFGGRIMMAAGIALVVLAALPIRSDVRASFVILLLLITVATPALYSYFYWRNTQQA